MSEEFTAGGQRGSKWICSCENPTIVRTMAKGTPAQRKYCECGGIVRVQ